MLFLYCCKRRAIGRTVLLIETVIHAYGWPVRLFIAVIICAFERHIWTLRGMLLLFTTWFRGTFSFFIIMGLKTALVVDYSNVRFAIRIFDRNNTFHVIKTNLSYREINQDCLQY